MCVVNFVEESDSRWKESPAESLCPISWVLQPAAEVLSESSALGGRCCPAGMTACLCTECIYVQRPNIFTEAENYPDTIPKS